MDVAQDSKRPGEDSGLRTLISLADVPEALADGIVTDMQTASLRG